MNIDEMISKGLIIYDESIDVTNLSDPLTLNKINSGINSNNAIKLIIGSLYEHVDVLIKDYNTNEQNHLMKHYADINFSYNDHNYTIYNYCNITIDRNFTGQIEAELLYPSKVRSGEIVSKSVNLEFNHNLSLDGIDLLNNEITGTITVTNTENIIDCPPNTYIQCNWFYSRFQNYKLNLTSNIIESIKFDITDSTSVLNQTTPFQITLKYDEAGIIGTYNQLEFNVISNNNGYLNFIAPKKIYEFYVDNGGVINPTGSSVSDGCSLPTEMIERCIYFNDRMIISG